MGNKASEDKITMHIKHEEILKKRAEDEKEAEEFKKREEMEAWIRRDIRYLVGKNDPLNVKIKAKLMFMWSEVRVENISATGTIFKSEYRFSQGDTINFNLGSEISNGYIEVRLNATVVDCKVNAKGSGYKTRVRFDGEPDDRFRFFLQKIGLQEQQQKKL